MQIIRSGRTQLIDDLLVTVEIDSQVRSDIYCTQIQLNSGTAGSSADFEVPPALWDESLGLLGKICRVVARYRRSSLSQTLFVGFISTINRDATSQSVTMAAKSVIGYADDCYIGGNYKLDTGLEVFYPKFVKNPTTGLVEATNWDMELIIKDWFSTKQSDYKGGGGSLQSQYRSLIKIGKTSVFDTLFNKVKLDDMTFSQKTLREGLDELLDLVQTVSFRERFVGYDTYLDFYEIGVPFGGVRKLVVAANADASTLNTNVFTISKTEEIEETKDDLLVVGDQRVWIATRTLVPLWDTEDTDLIADVLSNPEGELVQGAVGYDQTTIEYWRERNKVLREYKLPDVYNNVTILDNIPVLDQDGNELSIQFFKPKTTLTFDEIEEEWVGEIVENEFELVEGVEFDPIKKTVSLSAPLVYLKRGYVNESNKPVEEYEGLELNISFAYTTGERLSYHTGTKSTAVSLDRNLSRTQVITTSGLRYIQYGNVGWELNGFTGSGCILWDGDEFIVFSDSVYVDDTTDLINYSEIALTELCRKKESFSVETPYLTWTYKIGDRIRLNDETTVHQVGSITYNLTSDHSTRLETDTSIPQIATNVLKEDVKV